MIALKFVNGKQGVHWISQARRQPPRIIPIPRCNSACGCKAPPFWSQENHMSNINQVTLGDHQMRSSNNCLRERHHELLVKVEVLIPPMKDDYWTNKYAQSTLAPMWCLKGLHFCLITPVLGSHQLYTNTTGYVLGSDSNETPTLNKMQWIDQFSKGTFHGVDHCHVQ